jgi:hypothetical protein
MVLVASFQLYATTTILHITGYHGIVPTTTTTRATGEAVGQCSIASRHSGLLDGHARHPQRLWLCHRQRCRLRYDPRPFHRITRYVHTSTRPGNNINQQHQPTNINNQPTSSTNQQHQPTNNINQPTTLAQAQLLTDRWVGSQGGVGFDINCGVRLLRTNLSLDDLLPIKEDLTQSLFDHIPVGVGSKGTIPTSMADLEMALVCADTPTLMHPMNGQLTSAINTLLPCR